MIDQNRPDTPLQPIRPLVVPIVPYPDESLVGMVARSTRLNVLGRTNIITEEAGLCLLHPGTIGQDLGDLAPRLAQKLGCSVLEVEKRCHPYIGGAIRTGAVKFGSGAIERHFLELESRRCSPAALRLKAYHRASWMCRLMPYCPESLERLIDRCADCGAKLGWRKSHGLDRCDVCGVILRHPDHETLSAQFRDDYRNFAALISIDDAIRDAALRKLHPDVAALPANVLAHLILAMGVTCRTDRMPMRRPVLFGLEPSGLAEVIARGANLIYDWPERLRSAVRAQIEEAGLRNGGDHRSFRAALLKLGLPRNAKPEQITLVRAALPEVFEDARLALGGLIKPVISGSDVCKKAAIDPSELAALREAGLVEHFMVVKTTRTVAQYDEAFVDELARRKRGSERVSRLEQDLGVPRYASEQIACTGEVAREDHPAITFLDPVLRLVSEDVGRFIDDLEQGSEGGAPAGAIPLGTAMRRIGGRLKPWAAVLGAMRRGDLPYWISGVGRFNRRAHVRLEDLEQFLDCTFHEEAWPDFPFSSEITQVDTMDLLNLDQPAVRRLAETGDLKFRPSGVALVTERQQVLELANAWMSTSEIALMFRIDVRSVRGVMLKAPRIARHIAGWDRAACVEFAESRLEV